MSYNAVHVPKPEYYVRGPDGNLLVKVSKKGNRHYVKNLAYFTKNKHGKYVKDPVKLENAIKEWKRNH